MGADIISKSKRARTLRRTPRALWLALCRSQGANPNGAIIYRGPSLIDGAPIVVVATGLTVGSANGKTGAMVQTYVLRDNGRSPMDNVRSGDDVSICGACPHRLNPETGKRSCYVTLAHGPRSVSASVNRGRYVDSTDPDGPEAALVRELVRDRPLRLGTYGDPLAAPVAVWVPLINVSARWTGYTHQWKEEQNHDARAIVMASVDSEAEAAEARAMGWRYFRVRSRGADLIEGEIDCPSARGVACADCGLCSGNATRARSISIPAHGAGASAFDLIQIGKAVN